MIINMADLLCIALTDKFLINFVIKASVAILGDN